MDYDKYADEFCKKYEIDISINKVRTVNGFPGDIWSKDKRPRFQYAVNINRPNATMIVLFTDSIINYRDSKQPTKYDVLAALTKYPVEDTVEGFAIEYGYPLESFEDRSTVSRIWHRCQEEYDDVCEVFKDCLDELREIQ